MPPDLLYRIALTCVPNIGPVQARILLQMFQPADIFRAKRSDLERIEGIGTIRANCIRQFRDFRLAEKELRFIEKFKLVPLSLSDDRYPKRLLNCYDAPTLLYYKGKADLNASHAVSIIGTRNHTEYGRQATEKLIEKLVDAKALIVSGLAYGIDAIAHKSAMKQNLPTIGVLAHGLDQVYPHEHRGLAKEIAAGDGGLLTEFPSGTKPDKHNFPARNRIVAGMADATIVIETGVKGGSMITASLANSYNRDVFALPGRATDNKSTGCNELIRSNSAVLFTDASEILEALGWQQSKQGKEKEKQLRIFTDLNENERKIYDIIGGSDTIHIDDLNLRSGLSSSTVAAAVLSLELKNAIVSLPGNRYSIL